MDGGCAGYELLSTGPLLTIAFTCIISFTVCCPSTLLPRSRELYASRLTDFLAPHTPYSAQILCLDLENLQSITKMLPIEPQSQSSSSPLPPKFTANILPCRIHHSGAVSANKRHWNVENNESKTLPLWMAIEQRRGRADVAQGVGRLHISVAGCCWGGR